MKSIRLRKISMLMACFLVLFEIQCLNGFSLGIVSHKNSEGELYHSNSMNFDSHFSHVNKEVNMDFVNYGVVADTINAKRYNKKDEKIIAEIEKMLYKRMEDDISRISSKRNEELELASKSNFQSQNITTLSLQNNLPSQAEYNALMDFYQATDGANWTQNSGWSTANPNVIQDVSGFFGVSTNSNGNVVGIFLPSNNVFGQIPDSFGDLTNLEQVYLFNNNLFQTIPHTIGDLTNLKGLYLNSSRLDWDVIPDEIGNLINLEYLNLHSNYLIGTIPASIGNLTKLKELNLFFTKLEGDIPASIGNLDELLFLGLMGANLTGPIPSSFFNLNKLYQFRVHDNQLTGPVPDYFCSFPNLETLTLYNNKFTGTLPVCIYTAGINNLLLANNNFSAESIIDMALNLPNPSDYLPQNQSQDTVYVSVSEGDFLVLTTDLATTTQGVSEYRWVKNGTPLFPNFQQNAFEYTDTSFSCEYYPEGSSGPNSCNGVYYVEIKNSLLPVGTIIKGPPMVVKTISETLNMTICLFAKNDEVDSRLTI